MIFNINLQLAICNLQRMDLIRPNPLRYIYPHPGVCAGHQISTVISSSWHWYTNRKNVEDHTSSNTPGGERGRTISPLLDTVKPCPAVLQ